MPTTIARPASDRQRAFLRTLLAERADAFPEWTDNIRASLNAARTEGSLSGEYASEVIDQLLARPVPQAQPEIGVYVLPDDTIVKAQQNKARTNVYTMRWTEIGGERLVDATEERVHGEWVYDPTLKGRLSSARRMTLDEAKAFILRYGRCVRCSRKLKAADSVERGIGPICVTYFGGWS